MSKLNKFSLYTTALLFTFAVFSCKTTKQDKADSTDIAKNEEVRKVVLDEIDIYPDSSDMEESTPALLESTRKLHPFNVYRSSQRIDFTLIHTKIDVSFDWAKQQVIGKTTLTVKPHFYPQKQLILDAKGFNIKQITLLPSNKVLKYDYDNKSIKIDLDKEYTRKEKLEVFIEYLSNPNEGEQGGSAAITSDKGLFFINPTGEEKEKPMQIWTQGETENNSRWFPTIDKPNQFTTLEVNITVDSKYVTLSNGIKVNSKLNPDGTRTDMWKQVKPHAPYLTMIAVGDFAVVKDQWKNIPLEYIVEKQYEPFAKQIFNHTPEMLEFFSNKLDYPFAWDKYSQIIVRDYVSGAMENTTAVVFGDFVQKTDKELIDNDNDGIVAHEMFHHWFGNIVTCESWSNLTLQEGMANYAEYLWLEHKYGQVRADIHRANEMAGYLSSTEEGSVHPLIRYVYADKEEMFDAHSYNKGGLVLHMLRVYVGDEAFYAALNLYLNRHKHTSVEVDELRMAFEDVTGEDLNWFFDQWFLTEGHPQLSFKYTYDASKKEVKGYVTQKQTPAFRIPLDVALIDQNGKSAYHKVWIQNVTDSFSIVTDVVPSVVILDGKEDILAEIENEYTEEELYSILKYSPNSTDRNNAYSELSYLVTDFTRLIDLGLNDKLYSLQSNAISMISPEQFPQYLKPLSELAISGTHSEVRAASVAKLGENLAMSKALINEILSKEKSHIVLAAALSAYTNIDLEEAINTAEIFDNMKDDGMLEGIASVYAQDLVNDRTNWYLDHIKNKNIYKAYPLYQYLIMYASNKNDGGKTFDIVVDELYKLAMNKDSDKFKRYVSAMSIFAIKSQMEDPAFENKSPNVGRYVKYLSEIKAQETDPMLLEKYNSQF